MNLFYYFKSQKTYLGRRQRIVELLQKINTQGITGTFLVTALLLAPNITYADWADSIWSFVKSPIDSTLSAISAGGQAVMFAALEAIAHFFFWGSGLFLTMAGSLLDMSIQATISSDIYGKLQVVNVGWTTVRDFSNMFFIFALLYIAIKTILGLAGGSTKRWVANLIIAALLINFSLFATQVVIDAGNILAIGFWEKMGVTIDGKTAPSASMNLMQGLKIQTNFDAEDRDGNTIKTTPASRVIIYLGGGLVMLVSGYVFLAGAIMMILRTVTLILLMITSPFAFLSFALPTSGGFGNKWLSKLIGSSFVAPAFLAMIYLDIIIINGLDLKAMTDSDGTKFAGAFSGDVGSFPIIYNFIVVIIFMLASLTVANSVSSGAGSTGAAWSKRLIGYGAGIGLAGAAIAGRQGGGRVGKTLSESEWMKKAQKSNNRFVRLGGNMVLATGEKMKKGTWDARNAGANKALGLGGVNAGQGSKKSYDTHGGKVVGATLAGAGWVASKTPGVKNLQLPDSVKSGLTKDYLGSEREADLIKTAKSRFSTDAQAQRRYLEDKGVDLSAKRNKDLKEQFARDEAKKARNDEFEKQLKEVAGVDLKELGKLKPEEVAEVNKTIATNMETMGSEAAESFTKSFATYLDRMTGKDYADMGQNFMNLDVVQRNSSGKHVAEVQTRLADGTLHMNNIDAYRQSLTKNILHGNSDSARNALRNQIRQGNSNLNIDTKSELASALGESDEELREKKVKTILSLITPDDVARMDTAQLSTIDPYLTDSHYKAMGKKKREELDKLTKSRTTSA